MQDTLLKEKNFEEAIENYLITEGGYEKGVPEHLNRATALDEDTFIRFIKTTQPREWEKHCKNYPNNPEQALLKRFQEEVTLTDLLYVLRHGFKDRGVKFYPCYFKPETTMNFEHNKRYSQNILHCTRQMKFSLLDERSIDIVLLLNGIPVVSMELKNQFTGQDVSNAINQYKFDRATKDKMFEFKQRVLVHFAVDLYEVYMTTRLQGASTYFLPFNQGSNGAGNVGGKGNPQTEDEYLTSYLWKRVLTKDSLMEILQKYMHLQKTDIKDREGKIIGQKETMIFPRYHQLDVVTKLLADVKEYGSGKNYLIQHSAGSGKSNSIAWLAHRLQSLHDKNDEVIFNSVIVVTDRKILDSQLQDTIYQFDHIAGVVRPIKTNAESLKTALNDGVKIIITTLQKFPYIYQDVKNTGKKYAVIVDEAHSSQSGTAAKKLKVALGDTEEILEQYAREEAEEERQKEDYEDNLVKELSTHGTQNNISFFAFTATPKNKTLQLFGEKQENGNYRAFHIYSMRQAIEEGFILDVLQNYTTYKQYYKISKKIEGDPEYDKVKGARAVSRFESLHPHNIAQKTAIIIEHFRDITKNKIGGKAKAMLVTASRLHAVRYLFEFRRYIESHNYNDLDVLVAFSGSLEDGGQEWTEEKINKNKKGETIKENQLKDYFKNEFDMLIVAEKYQTGFDEPLLHTMFVDKKLNGVKAVQTLSRLNRTMRGKEDTFVLDFANEKDEIQRAFQPYYEATVLESETDPNLIYTLKRQLDNFHIYQGNEVEAFAKKFYQKTTPTLDALSPILKPALERYEVLENKKKDEFKSLLHGFNRTYAFIIQVARMFDNDMQKLYVFTKYLSKLLPKNNSEKNSIQAYDLLLSLNPYNEKDLLKAHKLMMQDLVETNGKYRTDGVGIFDGEKVVHLAPPADRVPELMFDLFKWLKESDVHPLIKSCVFHYEFEFIHPFQDGNGRIGRLWQTVILKEWKEIFAWLPVETLIKENQKDYYNVLGTSDSDANSTKFIEFMLALILNTIEEIISTEKKVTQKVSVKVTVNQQKIIDAIKENPYVTQEQLADIVGIARKNIIINMKKLQENGLIKRIGADKNGYWLIILSN